jgi:haloalkane dehalogenase
MDVLRTPDDRFNDVPDFDYEPRYAEVPDQAGGTLRMAYVRSGPADGPVVLLLHGEPSWSFLYRSVMPVLAAAGLCAIAPDLVGFGRSDKPADPADHSYARHVEWMRSLVFDVLDLRDVTLVGQDWGGLIGLRLVAEQSDRFSRVVAANTGLPTGDADMPKVWWQFRHSVERAPVLDVARFVARRLRRAVSGRVVQGRAARDAPSGADAAGRPGVRRQPRRLAGADPVADAVPGGVQRW